MAEDLRQRVVGQVPPPDSRQRLLPTLGRPLVKERGLALEVVEHRRPGHVGPVGDLVHGGRVEAALDEQFHRRAVHAVADLLTAPGPPV